jgi:hypothetical protein
VISLDASSTGCTLSNGVVSFSAVGTCVLDYNVPGNTNYLAAGQVQQSFAVVAATSPRHHSSVAALRLSFSGTGVTLSRGVQASLKSFAHRIASAHVTHVRIVRSAHHARQLSLSLRRAKAVANFLRHTLRTLHDPGVVISITSAGVRAHPPHLHTNQVGVVSR